MEDYFVGYWEVTAAVVANTGVGTIVDRGLVDGFDS
jgi:hypothetical protein